MRSVEGSTTNQRHGVLRIGPVRTRIDCMAFGCSMHWCFEDLKSNLHSIPRIGALDAMAVLESPLTEIRRSCRSCGACVSSTIYPDDGIKYTRKVHGAHDTGELLDTKAHHRIQMIDSSSMRRNPAMPRPTTSPSGQLWLSLLREG